jgi:hypothetical protein
MRKIWLHLIGAVTHGRALTLGSGARFCWLGASTLAGMAIWSNVLSSANPAIHPDPPPVATSLPAKVDQAGGGHT